MVCLRRTYSSSFLEALCYGFLIFHTVKCTLTNPLEASDMLKAYVVSNHYRCQRLCWYLGLCVRYSFYKGSNSDGTGQNCVLHGSSGQGTELLEGWFERAASGDSMSPSHGCKSRPCTSTEMCIPRGTGPVIFACVQIDVEECASIPCQNGGSCFDQVNGYTCHCPAGFAGNQCQTDTDECTSNPCLNGGSCTDQINGYTCHCLAGYTGKHCQTVIWLEAACSDHSACGPSHTGCFSGHCLCSDGYYYSHSQDNCIQHCSNFQNTYLHYAGYDLVGHDEKVIITSDLAACHSGCNQDPRCRVIVFVPGKSKCFIKYSTAQDFPGSWGQTSIELKTFQRTCQ